VAFVRLGLKAESAGQHLSGRFAGGDHEGNTAKAAQCVLRRHVAVRPAGNFFGALYRDEGQSHAVRVAEGKYAFSESFLRRFVGDVALDQALRPITER
jgi:hypothetical protein